MNFYKNLSQEELVGGLEMLNPKINYEIDEIKLYLKDLHEFIKIRKYKRFINSRSKAVSKWKRKKLKNKKASW